MPGSLCIVDGGAESPTGRGWDDFTSSHWVFSPGLTIIPSYRKILSTHLSTSVVLSRGLPISSTCAQVSHSPDPGFIDLVRGLGVNKIQKLHR